MQIKTPSGASRAVDLSKLTSGDELIIGRDVDEADVVVPDSQVSRAHCAIIRDGGSLFIEDLGSRNGTLVNGQPIQRHRIARNDRIVIGNSEGTLLTGDAASIYQMLGLEVGGIAFREVLGQGAFGTVYRGEQINLDREVALKVLGAKAAAKPESVESFLQEARHAARLNHPNLVQVYDVVSTTAEGVGSFYFLVMELMGGGSISDRLRVDGPLDQDTACLVLADIGRALAYATQQGLVHRDVKPDNILAHYDGVFQLSDLGIAATIGNDGQAQQDQAFGSAHYVAPEQASGQAIDGRADIYALGASVFHLLAGKPLFAGSSRELVSQHVHSEAPDLAAFRPDLDPGLISVIMAMLAKDPASRPQSGTEIAAIAEEILTNGSGAMTTGSGSQPGLAGSRRRRRRGGRSVRTRSRSGSGGGARRRRRRR
ncbi:MAG: protein kinase domain-containing protein [Planctomycetota bacterium]